MKYSTKLDIGYKIKDNGIYFVEEIFRQIYRAFQCNYFDKWWYNVKCSILLNTMKRISSADSDGNNDHVVNSEFRVLISSTSITSQS